VRARARWLTAYVQSGDQVDAVVRFVTRTGVSVVDVNVNERRVASTRAWPRSATLLAGGGARTAVGAAFERSCRQVIQSVAVQCG
jgi:hypothetical protein